MTTLVTKADLDNYKIVADSVRNTDLWPHFVSEAQQFDIKFWLGDALLNEILTQASTLPLTISTLNQLLLDGGSYIYNSKLYMFQGLKACIIYYAFARFVNRSQVNFTQAGITIKESDYSTPADVKMIQRIETENRLMADAIKCDIISYLDHNSKSYPLWSSSECSCSSNCTDYRNFKIIGE